MGYTEEQKNSKRAYMKQRREEAKRLGITLPGDAWHLRNPDRHKENGKRWTEQNPDKRAKIDKRYAENHPDKIKAKTKAATEKRKSLGIKIIRTDEQKARQREVIRIKRAQAKALGVKLASDDWAANNPEKHRENVSRWRGQNQERGQELDRRSQATRRSTPWGQINNRIWPILHRSVRILSNRWGKYNLAMGYTWLELRHHLESQFLPGMDWDTWGEVWEIDHIKPISSFHYESLADPLFKECWQLSNLRPLWRHENAAKGNKAI